MIDYFEFKVARGFRVKVDWGDYALVKSKRWRISNKGGYFIVIERGVGGVALHRILTSAPRGMVVDHINGDTLDNRRKNLRVCLSGQNTKNSKKYRGRTSSAYKGVTKVPKGWRAQIMCDYKKQNLGTFETELDAALAYDRAAIEKFGEFARTNIL